MRGSLVLRVKRLIDESHLVVSTGASISAYSGALRFRGPSGSWGRFRDLASPEGFSAIQGWRGGYMLGRGGS